MKNNLIIFLVACSLGLTLGITPIMAQNNTENTPADVRLQPTPSVVSEAYDPLIPQLFAFDKTNQVFVAINNVDNTIDIIKYQNGKLERKPGHLVDVVEKRHDDFHIYRPQSVAIYDNHIVYLASHRDSCYLTIMDLEGKDVFHNVFEGRASAFSYSPEAKELYIAGENDLGYDIAVLDVSKGFASVSMDNANLSMHYKRPKKAEQILKADPLGIGMALTAMSVVFLSLILLYLLFKFVGNILLSLQEKRERKAAAQNSPLKNAGEVVRPQDVSGEIYAAIAASIYMYNNELHDEENTVLTITKVSKTYSPWSSKIYGLNTYFNNRRN
ncbi:MAG: OadG family protein [Bacteroidales bacterium]